MTISDEEPEFDEPEPDELDEDEDEGERPQVDADLIAEPPHPVNWNLLTAEEAEAEWAELDRWMTWLRHTFGLPASVLPPFWHQHPELVWELSAPHPLAVRLRPGAERVRTRPRRSGPRRHHHRQPGQAPRPP